MVMEIENNLLGSLFDLSGRTFSTCSNGEAALETPSRRSIAGFRIPSCMGQLHTRLIYEFDPLTFLHTMSLFGENILFPIGDANDLRCRSVVSLR